MRQATFSRSHFHFHHFTIAVVFVVESVAGERVARSRVFLRRRRTWSRLGTIFVIGERIFRSSGNAKVDRFRSGIRSRAAIAQRVFRFGERVLGGAEKAILDDRALAGRLVWKMKAGQLEDVLATSYTKLHQTRSHIHTVSPSKLKLKLGYSKPTMKSALNSQ